MRNLVIVGSSPDFLDKVSRALVSTGHRFLARCKDPDRAMGLIESRRNSDEPVKVLLADVPMNSPEITEFLRRLKENFPEVAAIVVERDDVWRIAIDVFSARGNGATENPMAPLDADGLAQMVDEAVARFADTKLRCAAVDQLWKKLHAYANSPVVIERFLDELLAFLEVESGSIFFFDEKRKRMVLVAARTSNGVDLVGLTKNVGEGVAGYVALHRKPLLVVSREAAPIPVSSPHQKRYETESFICAPVVNHDRLIGVLNLTEKKSREPFNEGDLDLVTAIVDQFSGSIEQAFNQRNLHDRNKRLSAAIKKAGAKLRDSKALLSFAEAFNTTIVNNIPLGVAVLDDKLTIRWVNSSFRDLFAERGKEVLGRPFVESLGSVSDEGRTLWEEKVRAAFGEEQACFSHFICPMAEGSRAIFNINTRRFSPPGNSQKDLLLMIVEDVTTDVMLKRKVEKSQRLAEMGELVAGVAHEINNPLDGIMRFTNIALRKADGDALLQECFGETKKGLERISRIVKSLMQYVRNCTKTLVETNVNETLDNILVLMSYMQTKRNVRIVKEFDPRLPAITARSNLDQVFINLVKNSFEAMEPGGTLEISTFSDKDNVFVRFKDTGCGIPRDVLSKLGETFVTTKENGTGLGLSICQEIIKQHQGELMVESEVGVGSTFTVRLPLQQQE